jgi:hypothetical protein
MLILAVALSGNTTGLLMSRKNEVVV